MPQLRQGPWQGHTRSILRALWKTATNYLLWGFKNILLWMRNTAYTREENREENAKEALSRSLQL